MSTNVQINVVSTNMENDSLKMKGAGMLKEPAGMLKEPAGELSVIHVKPGIKRNSNIYGEDGQLVAKLEEENKTEEKVI